MSRQMSLEQARAEVAWNAITKAKEEEKGYQGKYKSTARNATPSIQINGLGQTLAFWRSKPKEKHFSDIYDTVSAWVKGQIGWGGDSHLLLWITEKAETNEYRRATAEAIAFLNWLKRFAEAELEGEE